MVDKLTVEQRSRLMARIRSVNTGPEVRVRSLLHRLGYRFRLHSKDLPGTPDIVLSGRGAVVFVNGCFWHGHKYRAGRLPQSRTDYWWPKIEGNRSRDQRKRRQLNSLGWKVVSVWECELKNPEKLKLKLRRVLGP